MIINPKIRKIKLHNKDPFLNSETEEKAPQLKRKFRIFISIYEKLIKLLLCVGRKNIVFFSSHPNNQEAQVFGTYYYGPWYWEIKYMVC